MVNCYNSDNYGEDNNVMLKLLFGRKKYELKGLTFSKYEQKQPDDVINILDFDSEKLEIKEIVEKVLILYDNNLFLLGIQAFCRIAKRGKDLIKKISFKIMNQLASVKIWEVFATIHSKICSKILSLKTFGNS